MTENTINSVSRNPGALHDLYGAPGGNRTPDPLLRRQLLYPTEPWFGILRIPHEW